MHTASAPASLRSQAARVIAAHLAGDPAKAKTLAEAGGEVVCDLLIALERRFRVDLDVSEAWALTPAELAHLVEVKVRNQARKALLPCNDDTPGQAPRNPPLNPPPSGERDRKAAEGALAATLTYQANPFPAEPAPFLHRKPIARELRDRARRARRARKRRQDLAVVARLLRRAAMLGAAMGALAFSLGWL